MKGDFSTWVPVGRQFPAVLTIGLQGVTSQRAEWFKRFDLKYTEGGETILSRMVSDQAASTD